MDAITETISRGAANQAGALTDQDAYVRAADFLPLKGIDHVEFWVGNARQASAYYRGFGVGNFKALFEAIEREQAKRGNL